MKHHRKSLLACLVLLAVLSLIYSSFYASQPHTHNEYRSSFLSLPLASTQPTNVTVDHAVATTGCGTTIPLKSGSTSSVSMTSNGTLRSYRIYLPAQYSNRTMHALVLNFHGYGDTASIQEKVSQFDPVADRNNFIVVYPNGSYDTSGRRGWNTGLHPDITANDTLFVSNLLNELQSNLCIQAAHIYATGLSNGGGFVNLLACTMSARIAAFGPVSGSYVTPAQDCHIQQPVSLLEFHGTADKIVPYQGDPKRGEPAITSWLSGWLNRDSCASTPSVQSANSKTVVYTWSDCAGHATITHYKIIGGEHSWPIGLYSETIANHTHNVNAATILWQFFAAHSLQSVTT